MVEHTCNPSYFGGKGRKNMAPGQARKKHETSLENPAKSKRTGAWQHMGGPVQSLVLSTTKN
jgi:hypothetical protein